MCAVLVALDTIRPFVSETATMRLPGLVLLAALLVAQGVAADSKCDPSSTNCAGAWAMTRAAGQAGPLDRPGSFCSKLAVSA